MASPTRSIRSLAASLQFSAPEGCMSTDNPAVTVLIPAFKVTQYIAQALDSCLNQTFQDFEIIVVNDGCPDTEALERVLAPYQQHIRYIKQKNTGLAGACNTAIRAARAPLILHLDADDWLVPECLESQVAFMRDHPELDAVYSNSIFFGDTDWNGTYLMDHYPSEGDVTFLSVIESRTCPANPASIIRREALFRVGLYDEELRSWEDYDMWLRILKSGGRMGYNRKPLVHYRRWQGSLTTQALRYGEYALRVLDKAKAAGNLTSDELRALEKRRAGMFYDVEILRGKRAIDKRDWPAARVHFAFCVNQAPENRKLKIVYLLLSRLPWLLAVVLPLRERIRRLIPQSLDAAKST
jgi:glycosyltransferase involved in cell wall biosynthesis